MVQTGEKGVKEYHFHKEKIQIIPSDISIVEGQIKEVYHKIMNKEFTKGCGKEDCLWCNFTRDYYAINPSALNVKDWPIQSDSIEE